VFFVLGLCAFSVFLCLFCVKKTRCQLFVGSGFVEIVYALVRLCSQRSKQVRQPATGVVVMPIRNVAVNRAPKHR
jgi:hypothetical protein